VQVPPAGQLGIERAANARFVQIRDELIVQHHGGVKHASERRHRVPDLHHDALDILWTRDVAAGIHDVDAVAPQVLDGDRGLRIART
jgi:hypothetical protein